MVIAPSKKNTISLTSAVACDNSERAMSLEGACQGHKRVQKCQTTLGRKIKRHLRSKFHYC